MALWVVFSAEGDSSNSSRTQSGQCFFFFWSCSGKTPAGAVTTPCRSDKSMLAPPSIQKKPPHKNHDGTIAFSTFLSFFCKLKNICINILKMSTILSLRVASFLFISCFFLFSFSSSFFFSSLLCFFLFFFSRLYSAVLEQSTEACYSLSSGYCVLPPTSPLLFLPLHV